MKKAQAAMEFLMTYGWAVVVILVVIGLLFSLRVFDLPAPTTCSIPNPYICRDMKVDSGTDIFTIKIEAVNIDPDSGNNVVRKIVINGVTCQQFTYDSGSDLRTASEVPVIATCDFKDPRWTKDFNKGDRFEGQIELQYQKFGGSARIVTGTFSGKVE